MNKKENTHKTNTRTANPLEFGNKRLLTTHQFRALFSRIAIVGKCHVYHDLGMKRNFAVSVFVSMQIFSR